jgi:transcriptional regulator with XRE-family HTH domain
MISDEAPTLAMLRLAHQLTSLELTRRLGVAEMAIDDWEAGRSYPSPRQQHALCQVLHVTHAALFRALAATYDPSLVPAATRPTNGTQRCSARGRRRRDQ